MSKLVAGIGWLLSYFQIVVLVPFGTCTQGNDGPWTASIIYSFIPLTGLALILVSPRASRQMSVMALPHLATLGLILWNIPSYWWECTIKGHHICAGFARDYINAFEPESWHRLWAPYVTGLGLTFVFLGYRYFTQFVQGYRTRRSQRGNGDTGSGFQQDE